MSGEVYSNAEKEYRARLELLNSATLETPKEEIAHLYQRCEEAFLALSEEEKDRYSNG